MSKGRPVKRPIVRYAQLVDVVIDAQRKIGNRRLLLLIGGCSQSGKSTLANNLCNDLREKGLECCLIHLDNWIKDIRLRTGKETVRERFDYEAMVNNIRKLMTGHSIRPPLYDSKTRTAAYDPKGPLFKLRSGGIGIIEGVVALDAEGPRNIADLKIFVDVGDRIRRERLLQFYTGHKCCSREEAMEIIESREKEEVPIIKSTMNLADYVYSGQEEKRRG